MQNEIKTAVAALADLSTTPATTPDCEFLSWFEVRNAECQSARDACARFVDQVIRGGEPYHLSLVGRSGVGKTALARAVVEEIGGKFRKWSRIVEAARDAAREGRISPVRPLGSTWALCVDDVAAAHETAFSCALGANLIEDRLGKWTIWTSNLSVADIAENVDPRFASRMIRGLNEVVTFRETTDYALKTHGQA